MPCPSSWTSPAAVRVLRVCRLLVPVLLAGIGACALAGIGVLWYWLWGVF